MIEAWTTLIADPHWPYIWPCYAMATLVFVGLTIRAVRDLRRWRARARSADPPE